MQDQKNTENVINHNDTWNRTFLDNVVSSVRNEYTKLGMQQNMSIQNYDNQKIIPLKTIKVKK